MVRDSTGGPLARNARGGNARDIAEIADAEKINESYVGRVLRLTLLTLDIVEAILGGGQPAELQLEDLLGRLLWFAQRSELLRLTAKS